jgi:ABC-2 type transport system permease protein
MRVKAIVIRIMRQFFRDKRTLGMIIVAPILILWLMSLVFNGDEYKPTIAFIDVPTTITTQFKDQKCNIITSYTIEKAKAEMDKQNVDAFVQIKGNKPAITLEGSDPAANKAVLFIAQKAFQQMQPNENRVEMSTTYLHGSKDMEMFDNIGPFLIGYFVFFFVFLIAGVSFLRERTTGTLERLLATPLKRWEIVVGYVLGFGIFTTFQTGLIVWFSIKILDIMMQGSVWLVFLTTLLLAITALTLGTLLSAYANNELQMIQFIPLVIVPQIFFSGLFNMDTMSPFLKSLSVIMPLTYGGDAMKEVMLRGKGWDSIAMDIYVLIAFSLAFMILNIIALKKHRKL